jgi:hypothetical protein
LKKCSKKVFLPRLKYVFTKIKERFLHLDSDQDPVTPTPLLSAPATLVPDPATAMPGGTIAPEATAANAAATAVTAASPASSPVSSAAAPVAALEAALAAASMTAPSGATTTLGAVGIPDTPATEHLMSPDVNAFFFVFLYKK